MIAQSTIVLDEILPVGTPYMVQVLAKDRRGRASATAETICTYDMEYYEIFRGGRGTFNAATLDLSFVVQPNITGRYWVTVYIDGSLMAGHPQLFTVSTSLANYDPITSTAVGLGLEIAGAGDLNTFFLFLRDFWGNVITPEYHIPLLGYPFYKECGYNYAMLQDGSQTAGYGNPGTWRFGLAHGCKIGLHVYVMDWNGLPIRPARGFEVLEISPQPDSSVKFVYTIHEAGLHSLYFRYINSDGAGYMLHNSSGDLSLASMSRSRDGQIHGSPFQLRVAPGVSSVERSRVTGSGIIAGAVDSADWTRFDISSYDSFGNQAVCTSQEINVTVRNPNNQEVESVIRDADGSPYDDACHIYYRPEMVGEHRIDVLFRDQVVQGGPFHPTLAKGTNDVVDWMTSAVLVAENTRFPCYLNVSQAHNERCTASTKGGSVFAIRVSARDPRGLLPNDEQIKFSVRIQEQSSELMTGFNSYRLMRGEHELEAMLTASGLYRISVSMTSKPIAFQPFSSTFVQIMVAPAATHPAACLISGQGLSIATAGIQSSFLIVPRDAFGNRQVPTPSPDPRRDAPGAGIFHVRVCGPLNTLTFAKVIENADGTFKVLFDVTWMGQYSIGITMLDEVPTLSISSAAVVRRAHFRSHLEGYVKTAPGRHVSSARQPITLLAEPNVPSTGLPCIDICCDAASRYTPVDLASGPAVAGESFKVALELIDICGNPTESLSEDARIYVYGPLSADSKPLFDRDPLSPGIMPLISRANAMNELHKWQEMLLLTVSGEYGLAVSLNGQLVHEGSSIIKVLPVDFTATDQCSLDRDISLEPLPASGFEFLVETRDPYGNSRVTSSERFELDLYPVKGNYNGISRMTSNVQYVSGGTYHARITDIGTYGQHTLTIRHEGRHILGSPFSIDVIGGYMDSDNSDTVFSRVSPSAEVLLTERVLALGIDDTLKMDLQGRDRNGALTRLGLDTISFSVVHETRGDITPTSQELAAIRTQADCTQTNFGTFCQEPPQAGTLPLFFYEVKIDAQNAVNFGFTYQARAKCRSLSGFDELDTVFSNTIVFTYPVVKQELGGEFMNITINKTYIITEYHPTSPFDLSMCETKCAEFNCTCATLITNTGTYRDGTCVALGKVYFLETFDLLEFPGNSSTAILTTSYRYKSWETINYENPLQFHAKSRVSGNIKLHMQIAGENIRGSPFSLFYSPGLLSINQSTIVIRNTKLEVVCLTFSQTNCVTPAAGEDYTLSFTPRDSEGNTLVGSPPESQYRVQIKQAREQFEGLGRKDGRFSVAFDFTPKVSGSFQISAQQETTFGNILRPFQNSVLQLPLKSAANSMSGTVISFDKSECRSECIVSATVPNDVYDNPLDASYTLLLLDQKINAYTEEGRLSNLVSASTNTGSSTYALTFTRSGQYVVEATSIHGSDIPGSPLSIAVTPDSQTMNTTIVSGPGVQEITLNEHTFFDIITRDQYGNPVLCYSANVTVVVSKNHVPITTNTTSGNHARKSCRTLIKVPEPAGVVTLNVLLGSVSLMGSNVTLLQPPGPVPSKQMSSASCYVITTRFSKRIATPCSLTRTQSSIGDDIIVEIMERTKGGGLVGSKAILLDIEGENATAPWVVNAPNYTEPRFPWTLEFEECDQLMFLASNGKLCSPVGDDERFEFVASTETFGEYSFTKSLERTGIFQVFYRLPQKSYGYMTEPWYLDVRAMETDLSQVQIYGTGLDRAIYNEEATFTLEDRDKFGNLRAGTELVSIDLVRDFNFDFTMSVVNAQSDVIMAIRPAAKCLLTQCFLLGTYSMAYKVQLPSGCSFRTYLTCPDALRPATADVTLLYKNSPIFQRNVDITVGKINYTPATATMQGFTGLPTGQTPNLQAGRDYTLNVQPQDLYQNRMFPSFEQLRVQIEKGQPEFVMGRTDGESIFTITFQTTVAGTYYVAVLDGEAHLRGSPFPITVLPGLPNPQSCVLQGTQAFVTSVDVANTITANLVDIFGNIVTKSEEALVSAFISTMSGTSLLQIPGVQIGALEMISFTITRPGLYRMQVKVGHLIVNQGQVLAGSVTVPLRSEGHVINVRARGTCASQCQVYGQGLSIATAGDSATFFVLAKDEFGKKLQQQGEFFGVTVDGNLDSRCSVSTDDGYLGRCIFTKSGSYNIVISFGGDVIADRRSHILKVEAADTYPLASYLEQKSPKMYMEMVDGIVFSSTTDFIDGAFLGSVGHNSYTLILNDRFGNRLDADNLRSDTNSSDPIVNFWVKKQLASYTGGFLLWDEGAEVAVTNASAPKAAEGDGLDEFGNPIQAVNITVEEVLPYNGEEVPFQLEYNKSVVKNLDGTYSVAFQTTAAGKYRLQVYIDGVLIRRYIPLEEIGMVQVGLIKSNLDCCVPWDDLRKIPKVDGICPASASMGPVCGDLLTLLPLEINTTNSFVLGNVTKQFRKLVDGDGEGNKGSPKFQIATLDTYGNAITAANFEMRVTVLDINGTVVLTQPMISTQPKLMQFNCRTVPANPKCGTYEFEWTGLSASRSGKYRIDVTYNGISIGVDTITTQIRSVGPEIRSCQIWGPGLQIAVAEETTYFYFRIKDQLDNEWEPDSIDDKQAAVDFGGTAEFFGISYPQQDPLPKLQVDSLTFNPRTKLIYFGYGLYQVQYVPWLNATNERGSFRILLGENVLAQPGPGVNFVPLVLGTAGYDAFKPHDLVPDALTSFATGSGLYNHFAGDEIEVTAHGLTNYKDIGGGYWPSTTDVDGKQFVIEVRGPPGVSTRRFLPKRGSTNIKWQFQSKWISSISGMYIVSILYDNTHVRGDSSTNVIFLPQSPFRVQVYQAPVQPQLSTLSGSGLSATRVGEIATFLISLRDIFNNPITKSNYYAYKGDELVNASLITTKGPSVHAQTVSLRDGNYRCEYAITKTGEYNLMIMVNGVPITNPPLRVLATNYPDFRFTRWFMQRAGMESEMCTFSDSQAMTDIDGVYLNPGCMSGLLYAGDILEAIVELRDTMNNTIDVPLTNEDVNVKLIVEGQSLVEKYANPLGYSTFSAVAGITKAGAYSITVLMGESLLPGSPYTVNVSASILYIPACFTTGDGLQSTLLNRTRGLVIHGRDVFGNNQTLERVTLEFNMRNVVDAAVETFTSVQLGMLADLYYRIVVPGDYQVSVQVLDSDHILQTVPLSDVVVTAYKLPSPEILATHFTQYVDNILVQFDSATDMACMHGRVHSACLVDQAAVYGDCCFVFNAASCQTLGLSDPLRQAKCIWQSPFEMTINLGVGATIGPRDRLTFNGVVRNQIGTSNYIEGSVHVDPPALAMYPILAAAYFPVASECQIVQIDASQTVGSGGRPMSFEWSVGPQIRPLHNVLKSLSSNKDNIEFNYSLLGTGTTEVTLRVQNFLNYATSTIIEVEKKSKSPLRTMIIEGSSIDIYRTQPLTLTGQVEASSCDVISELRLSWFLVSGPDLNFGNLTLANSVLSLPSFFFTADSAYVLAFRAVALISGQILTVETQTTITVLSSPLMATIAGPYGQVSHKSLLVWDATASFDPDLGGSLQSAGQLGFLWSCNPVLTLQDNFPWKAATVSAQSCFYDFTGILLQPKSLLNLTGILPDVFMCKECLPGVFRINLNVTKNVLGNIRCAMSSIVISISGLNPEASLAGIIPVPYLKVSPSQRLFIDGFEVNNPLTTSPHSDLQYEWTLYNRIGCCLGQLNMSADLARIFPTGTHRPFLIIKPNTLSQGLGYVFQFTLRNIVSGASSSTFVHLDVDSGPQGGKFLVSPSTGTMTGTSFDLRCVDWTDDVEDLPLQFDFEYAYTGINYPIPFQSSKLPKVDFQFPDVSRVAILFSLHAKIRDVHGTTKREEITVMLQPSGIDSLTQAAAFVESQLGIELERDIASTDLKRSMERINIAISVMNKLSTLPDAEASSRTTTQSKATIEYDRRVMAQFSPLRSKVLASIHKIARNTTHSRFTVNVISAALHLNTDYSEQIGEKDFDIILSTCETLMAESKMFVENINASVPFAGTLRNLLYASRQFSMVNANRFNLRKDEILVGKVMRIKNILSQAILMDKLPEEEFVSLQTSAFLINCRRVRADTAKGLIMGANTLLESQYGLQLQGSSSYSITDDTIDFKNLRYKVDDGSFYFGTHPYPMTLYDTLDAFPKSTFPEAYRSLDMKLFQQSPPMTQKDYLTLFYLDFEITQWKFAPFETGERQRTELDLASTRFGRASSIACSSSFIDCSTTNHVCTPDPVEGSQGPDYADTACENAFDGDGTTVWAVDPQAISDPTGAGSTVAITFIRPFVMTMVRYTPRIGPRYCAGSEQPCEVSSLNCICVIGGDKNIRFTFGDGTVQNIELAKESYETQLFDLEPVTTDSVNVKVLSVYSNPTKCPPRDTCAWWQPACVDWCPNGAASIEFLSTEPLVGTYDHEYSYMTNYSVSAALVSDVTSMEVRQYDHVMRLFALETPLQLNLTVQPERRSGFTTNDQTMVVCRSWDDSIGRWSPKGTLLAGSIEDPEAEDRTGVHSCQIFFVANFSLVVVEKPSDGIETVMANLSMWRLSENTPDSLVCVTGLVFIFMCYCLVVVLRFRGWLKVWHKEETGKRTRMNEYFISLSNPLLRGRKTDDRPIIQPFYYPIVGLFNSRVIAAHTIARNLLYRIHFYNSLARWHYLYSIITGHDEISRFARLTIFFCLVMFSFALNACTISGATFNGVGSLIQTPDSVPSRWWFEAIKGMLVIFPIAQVLPAFFRMISMRHEDFDRWEVSDVLYSKDKVKPKVVFGNDGLEKRSDLKTLRFKIGSTAVFDLLNPIVGHDKHAPQQVADQEVTITELIADGDDGSAGTLKHFVRKLREYNPDLSLVKDSENDPSLSLSLSMSIGSGTATTSSTASSSTTSSKINDTKLSAEDTVIREVASLRSNTGAKAPVVSGKKPHESKTALRLAAKLAKEKDKEEAVETIELDENGEAKPFKPHPPTPRIKDPPPVAPLGVPARRLSYHQEKSLLRKRWMKRREMETVYFASGMRKTIFDMLVGDGVSYWFRGQRPVELLFFPNYFIYLAYAICVVWLVLCYCTCLIYTTGFDRDMAFAWAYASMATLVVECAFSQTVLALAVGWWKHVDGRVTFYKALIKWSLFRADLMPAMG